MAIAYPLAGQPSFMAAHNFEVIMISAAGVELPHLLKNETCPHIIVPMTRSITPFRDLVCIYQLIRIFRRERPDIVHTETPKAGLLGMISAKIAGVGIRIHTVAGLPLMTEKGMKLYLLEFIEKITYAAATNVWPNSNSLRQFILKRGYTKESKLTMIGLGSSNGINTKRFDRTNLNQRILNEVKASVQYSENNTYILFIGRLVRDKGIAELAEAFTELQTEFPRLKLILAGTFERELDPLPSETVTIIHQNGSIFQLSWTNHVEYYMALADYFVFPSYREGFPNVLLEAASMQLPIICSRIAGNVDIVQDGKTGLIFESQNKESLKLAMRKGLNDPAWMKLQAERLHAIITTSFKRENFWETMLEEYNKLIASKK